MISTQWPVVPNEEVAALHQSYADLLAWWERTVGRPAVVVRDDHGVVRFKPNAVYKHLKYDLDALHKSYLHDLFPLADYAEFVAGLGYSLAGFCDLSQFSASIWPDTEDEEGDE